MNKSLPANTVSAGGRGIVPVAPDLIRISLYVTGEGMLTEDAQRAAERKAEGLKEALQKAFPKLDTLSISPARIGEKMLRMGRPDASETPRPEIVYLVSITAGIAEEKDVSRIIDTALRAGAAFQAFPRGCGPDGGSAISYGIKDHRPAEQEAGAKALDDARERALALAKLAGKTFGGDCFSG
jgi:uncharacterized protein YggE